MRDASGSSSGAWRMNGPTVTRPCDRDPAESKVAANADAFEIVDDLMVRSIALLGAYKETHDGRRPDFGRATGDVPEMAEIRVAYAWDLRESAGGGRVDGNGDAAGGSSASSSTAVGVKATDGLTRLPGHFQFLSPLPCSHADMATASASSTWPFFGLESDHGDDGLGGGEERRFRDTGTESGGGGTNRRGGAPFGKEVS